MPETLDPQIVFPILSILAGLLVLAYPKALRLIVGVGLIAWGLYALRLFDAFLAR